MTKLNDFDRAKVGHDRMKSHDSEIWNEAIEAAAKVCKDMGTIITVEEQIRKLKIDTNL